MYVCGGEFAALVYRIERKAAICIGVEREGGEKAQRKPRVLFTAWGACISQFEEGKSG
jgi:hypothetical protein